MIGRTFAGSCYRLACGVASPRNNSGHAREMDHEGIPLPIIQRHVGDAHRGIRSIYLQGISSEEIISTVHARRAPTMHASAGLAWRPLST